MAIIEPVARWSRESLALSAAAVRARHQPLDGTCWVRSPGIFDCRSSPVTSSKLCAAAVAAIHRSLVGSRPVAARNSAYRDATASSTGSTDAFSRMAVSRARRPVRIAGVSASRTPSFNSPTVTTLIAKDSSIPVVAVPATTLVSKRTVNG